MRRLLNMGLLIAISLMLFGCPGGYGGNFLNVTNYRIGKVHKTLGGVRFSAPDKINTVSFRVYLDLETEALEQCLGKTVRRDWFVVLVPSDWYVSKCSGEQLVPSRIHCQLCWNKGLDITNECCKETKPTEACPCVCNARATVQDNSIIVTAPNLKLYRAELARLVTGINNVWVDPQIKLCL